MYSILVKPIFENLLCSTDFKIPENE